MDVGCYTVNILRHFMGSEPTVQAAQAKRYNADSEIDLQMNAQMLFPCGATGDIQCSIWGWPPLSASVSVQGSKGSLSVINPIGPHFLYHRQTLIKDTGHYHKHFTKKSTYEHQLEAFVAAIQQGDMFPTNPVDGCHNMALIDAIYQQAGMKPRRGIA